MLSLKTLQTLGSSKPHEVKQAVQALEAAPPVEATAALLDLCEQNKQDRKRLLAIATWSIISCGSLWLLFKIGIMVSEAHPNPTYLFGMALFLLPACIIPAIRSAREPRWKEAAMALLDYDDARILVPLLELTAISTSDELAKLPRLLSEISRRLWHLAPGDTLAFDKDARTAIREIVGHFYPQQWPQKRAALPKMTDEICDVVVAALRAVALLGDAKARKIVAQIADAPAKTSNERCVQEVAQECLALLDARVAEKADIQKRLAELLRDFKNGDNPIATLHPLLETLSFDEATVGLAEQLKEMQRKRQRKSLIVSACRFMIWASMMYYCLYHMKPVNPPFTAFLIILQVSPLITEYRNRSIVQMCERAVAVSLSQYKDVRLVGSLLDAHRNYVKSDYIEDALINLLPQLKPGDRYLVSPRQQAHLRHIVQRSDLLHAKGTRQELLVAALDALRVSGDTKAVQAARRIARVSGSPAVCHAAERLIAAHEAGRKTEKARVGTMTP